MAPHDVLAGVAGIPRRRSGRGEALGRQDEPVAAALEPTAEDLLGAADVGERRAQRVRVRRVEEGDAGLRRRVEDGHRGRLVALEAERHRAQAQPRDAQPGAPESNVFHGRRPYRCPRPRDGRVPYFGHSWRRSRRKWAEQWTAEAAELGRSRGALAAAVIVAASALTGGSAMANDRSTEVVCVDRSTGAWRASMTFSSIDVHDGHPVVVTFGSAVATLAAPGAHGSVTLSQGAGGDRASATWSWSIARNGVVEQAGSARFTRPAGCEGTPATEPPRRSRRDRTAPTEPPATVPPRQRSRRPRRCRPRRRRPAAASPTSRCPCRPRRRPRTALDRCRAPACRRSRSSPPRWRRSVWACWRGDGRGGGPISSSGTDRRSVTRASPRVVVTAGTSSPRSAVTHQPRALTL